MKKVLVFTQEAVPSLAWDISFPELRNKAYIELFGALDSFDLFNEADQALRTLLDMARAGNYAAAEALCVLLLRSGESRDKFNFEEINVTNCGIDERPQVHVKIDDVKHDLIDYGNVK